MTINRVVGAIYRDNTNIGLGTTLPTYPLHVYTPDGTPGGVLLQNAASLAVQSSTTSANAWGLGLAPGTSTLGVAYGALSNQVQASNIKLAMGASGNVGVGTTTPAYTLDVAGSINFTAGLYQNGVAYGGGGGGGTGASWIDGVGAVYTYSNVGIGTTAPRSTLDVVGTVRATSYIGEGSGITGITTSNYRTFPWSATPAAPAFVTTGGTLTYATQRGLYRFIDNMLEYNVSLIATVATPATAGTEVYLTLPYPVSTTLYTSSSNAIGELWAEVITPTSDTFFKAVARVTPASASYAAVRLLSGTSEIPLSTVSTGATIKLMGTLEYASASNTQAGTSSASTASYSVFSISNINSIGNVGIGTTQTVATLHVQNRAYFSTNVGIGTIAPRAPLDVLGTVLSTSVGIGTTAPRMPLNVVGDALVSRNVGIGTTSPIAALHVQGRSYFSTNVGIGATAPRALLDVQGTVLSTSVGIGTTLPRRALDVSNNILASANVGIGTTATLAALHSEGAAYLSGNVGIGTTQPAAALHVGGYQDAYVESRVRTRQFLPAYMHPTLHKMFCMPGGTANNYLDVSLAGRTDAKGFRGGFIDGRYAYLSPYFNGIYHGIFTRVDLQNWTTSGVTYLDVSTAGNTNAKGLYGGFTDGRYGYLIPDYNATGNIGIFTRIDLANFVTAGVSYLDVSTAGNTNAKGFNGGFTDGQFAYLIPSGNPSYGILTRINLQSFVTAGVTYLNVAIGNSNAVGFIGGFTDGRYGYLVPYNGGTSGIFTRVDLENFTTGGVSYLDISTAGNTNAKGFTSGFTDGRYGFLVPHSNGINHGIFTRVDLQNFATSGVSYLDVSTAGNTNAKGFWSGFTDGRYGYLMPYINNSVIHGILTRVDLTNWTTSGVSYLDVSSVGNTNAKGFIGGVTDGRYGYLVPYNGGASGILTRVLIADMYPQGF